MFNQILQPILMMSMYVFDDFGFGFVILNQSKYTLVQFMIKMFNRGFCWLLVKLTVHIMSVRKMENQFYPLTTNSD